MSIQASRGQVIAVVVGLWPTLVWSGPAGVGDPVAARSAEARAKYDAGEYDEALSLYRDAQVEAPDSELLNFNVGDALYKTGDFEGALQEFLQSTRSGDAQLEGPAWYNAGNAHFEVQRYEEAIEAYKEALKRFPANDDAKANLEFARQQMQEQSQSQQQDGEGEKGEDGEDQPSESSESKEEGTEEEADRARQPGDEEDGREEEEEKPSEVSAEEEEKEEGESADNEEAGGQKGDERNMEPEEAERLLDALSSDELDAQHRRIRLRPSRQVKDW